MIVVHGTWVKDSNKEVNGRFFVWGESLAAARQQKELYLPRPAKNKVPLHPFQASDQELITVLLNLSAGLYKSIPLIPPGLDKIQLLLPSTDFGPLPSPQLKYLPGSGEIARKGQSLRQNFPVLTPWEVKGLAVSPVWVINVLPRLGEGHPVQMKGNILAPDFLFWSLAAKLALELLVRERFVPVVLEEVKASAGKRTGAKTLLRQELRASWRALLDQPEDARRVELLAAGMPPACRAQANIPFPHPRILVEDFLHSAVDAMARYWLMISPLEGRTKGLGDDSTPARWAVALAAEKATFSGPLLEMKDLKEQIDGWTKTLFSQPGTVAFRTCFRLEPPERTGEEGRPLWQLQFLLQASDDPSLLVPVAEAWRERGSVLEFLNRRFANPQERLLADLGRAARIFPPLERSLKDPSPEGCLLTTEEAYAFLREAAGLLAESGFGVLVPPWWGKHKSRLGLRLKLKASEQGKNASRTTRPAAPGGLGLAALVNYEWEVALGDAVIDRKEFARLAALKVPLVQVRGQWVELRPEELAALDRFWKKQAGQGTMSLGEALRLSLLGGVDANPGERQSEGAIVPTSLPLLGIEAEGHLTSLLEKVHDNQKITLLPQPSGFRGSLRPYQVRGFSWLKFITELGLGACLADDMGLGKTIQLLALLLHRKEQGMASGPVLLICPTSVAGNWQREVARFAPSLRVLLHHGSERLSGDEFIREAARRDLVISTYTLVHRDEKDLAAVDWDGVVLDEAQNIKNAEAKQTRSIRSLKAGFRIALTGTPVENNLSELWSIMEFLNPGYLGSLADFRNRFMIPIERYRDRERAERLQHLVQPFILRRVKTDPAIIRDLPEKQEIKVFCHLTREQATLYEAVVQDMLQKIEAATGIERKGLVLAALAKLKQICNHPAQFLGDGSRLDGRSGKLTRLREMLEEVLAAGERALIFTQFAVMGQMLQEYLEAAFGREILFLHGGLARSKREELIHRFQEENDGPPFFILSLKAGGVGLNLTRANHVFHFDRWWNPAVEDQATDRAFRIGQKKNVQVYKFICAGTLEERIDALIEEKRSLAQQIIGTGEGWLTELSVGELRELLALRSEGIEL